MGFFTKKKKEVVAETPNDDEIASRSVHELRVLAKSFNISIDGLLDKAEVVAALKAQLPARAFSRPRGITSIEKAAEAAAAEAKAVEEAAAASVLTECAIAAAIKAHEEEVALAVAVELVDALIADAAAASEAAVVAVQAAMRGKQARMLKQQNAAAKAASVEGDSGAAAAAADAQEEEPECDGKYIDHADGKFGLTFDESCAVKGHSPKSAATRRRGWLARLFEGLSCSRPSPADVAEPEPPASLPAEGAAA